MVCLFLSKIESEKLKFCLNPVIPTEQSERRNPRTIVQRTQRPPLTRGLDFCAAKRLGERSKFPSNQSLCDSSAALLSHRRESRAECLGGQCVSNSFCHRQCVTPARPQQPTMLSFRVKRSEIEESSHYLTTHVIARSEATWQSAFPKSRRGAIGRFLQHPSLCVCSAGLLSHRRESRQRVAENFSYGSRTLQTNQRGSGLDFPISNIPATSPLVIPLTGCA